MSKGFASGFSAFCFTALADGRFGTSASVFADSARRRGRLRRAAGWVGRFNYGGRFGPVVATGGVGANPPASLFPAPDMCCMGRDAGAMSGPGEDRCVCQIGSVFKMIEWRSSGRGAAHEKGLKSRLRSDLEFGARRRTAGPRVCLSASLRRGLAQAPDNNGSGFGIYLNLTRWSISVSQRTACLIVRFRAGGASTVAAARLEPPVAS